MSSTPQGIIVGKRINVKATDSDGKTFNAETQDLFKPHNKAKKLNGRINNSDYLTMLSKVAKSSKDILLLRDILDLANQANEILIPNISQLATELGSSKESLKRLLKRSDDNGLLHKLGTGHYLLNPYVLLSKGLTYAGGEKQFKTQIRWSSLTLIMTESDKQALLKLSEFLNLETPLPVNEFVLSVANQFSSKGKLSEKQRSHLLKLVQE